jgi:hypothetical protein
MRRPLELLAVMVITAAVTIQCYRLWLPNWNH